MGVECYKVLQNARMKEVFKDEQNRLTYNWLIEVDIMKNAFINRFKETKFRSSFKKSFFSSISNSDRISKKQMAIIRDMLFDVEFDLDSLYKEIQDSKKEFLRKKTQGIDLSVAMAISRRKIRKNKN